MSIKPRLLTKLQAKQGLSPQLQHSIRLSSLPAMELLAEISQALDENPFLETSPEGEIFEPRLISAAARETVSTQGMAESWLESLPAAETLQSYLRWQANLTFFDEDEQFLADLIIDSVNDEGYLSAPLHEILPDNLKPSLRELAETVLHQIQEFDPPGVGASSLQECLCLQLNQYPSDCLLARRAKRLLHENVQTLCADPEVLSLIQSLNPKPGLGFGQMPAEQLIPDLILRQEGAHYQVDINEEALPKLQLNHQYAHALKISAQKNHPLQAQLNAAKSLIYHLDLRQNTLLRVARVIVNAQQGFFKQGAQALTPLKLEEISQATKLHTSTVSRLTSHKTIHTPRGLFALKYFLCGGVKANQGPVSTQSVQALIKQLVLEENKIQPLSDASIMSRLAEQGIRIARRTVAKYREALRIPSQSLRRLKQANQE